jgi:hypothetical protein
MSTLSYSGAEKPIDQVKDEIRDLIRESIERIQDDYKITHREEDGADEMGIKYWVYCNAWSGRQWEHDNAMNHAFENNRSNFIHQEIRIGSNTYHLNPSMFYQDWSSTKDFLNFKVELLTKEEHIAIAGNTERLIEIRGKIITKSNNQLKVSDYKTGYFFVAYELVQKIETLLKMVLLTSPGDFIQSLNYLDSNVASYNKVGSKIKKLVYQLDDSDRTFLGFE